MKRKRWTPFDRCVIGGMPTSCPGWKIIAIWKNNFYQVVVESAADQPIGIPLTHLSIKRRDKREIHDWRDLQRIKTEILGPDVEAVEVYPSEDRLLDEANQYHLWAFPPGYRVPVGYFGPRNVRQPDKSDGTNPDGSRQRPYPEDWPTEQESGIG